MKVAIVLAILASMVSTAHAEPSPEELFDQGQAAFEQKDFPAAIAKWRESFRISNEPELLFNIAQAYRLNGDCTNALATYRQFLSLASTSEQRPLAEDLVRELSLRCPPKRDAQIDKPIERPVEHHQQSGRVMRTAGLVTGGTGVALLATGLVLGQHAASLGDEVTAACATSCDWAMQREKDADGRRLTTFARVLDVAGIAAIAGGAVMYYFGSRKGTLVIVPHTREGGVALSWSAAW